MKLNTFINVGKFSFVIKCITALCAIVKSVLAIRVKNHLISPVREWLSDLIFYSVFTSLLILTASVIDVMDYTKENALRFKRTAWTTKSLKPKLYMTVTVIEAIILVTYCISLQCTSQMISAEVRNILHAGLRKYCTNREWKLFWDRFQRQYECCGSFQSTDWFQIPWLSPTVLPRNSSLLKKYTQDSGRFVIQAAPMTCCLPDTNCDTCADCEQPDPEKYYKKGCFFTIAETIDSIDTTRFFVFFALVIQIISTVFKFEGHTEDSFKANVCQRKKKDAIQYKKLDRSVEELEKHDA